MTLSPQDALALQIGRGQIDLAVAKQTIVTQQQRIAELEAVVAAFEEKTAAEPATGE